MMAPIIGVKITEIKKNTDGYFASRSPPLNQTAPQRQRYTIPRNIPMVLFMTGESEKKTNYTYIISFCLSASFICCGDLLPGVL